MRLVHDGVGVSVELAGGELLPLRHVIGVGRNYAEHARERGADVPDRPMLFTKSFASVVLDGEAIRIPPVCADPAAGGEQVDYEAELAVIIGRACRDATEATALEHVLGYCCANDVSARWWQKSGSGGQFFRGKSFDTFCPLGPGVTPAGEVGDPQGLGIRCRVNGELMQEDSTGKMMFSVRALIAEISRGATLPAGSVLLTGTPSGVGAARTPPRFLRDGDVVEVEIDGLGTLRNPVAAG
jgi:2-keto-4-pentenoate hydratase/2-oxohepta-3-ene-1,7-dioic acid hydratase in catechol pathway